MKGENHFGLRDDGPCQSDLDNHCLQRYSLIEITFGMIDEGRL